MIFPREKQSMLKVVVVGLGKFGSTLAVHLSREGAEVLAVDRSTRLVEAVADEVDRGRGFRRHRRDQSRGLRRRAPWTWRWWPSARISNPRSW